jgi:hypothetical protein
MNNHKITFGTDQSTQSMAIALFVEHLIPCWIDLETDVEKFTATKREKWKSTIFDVHIFPQS